MGKVWISQWSEFFNYSSATKYGDLRQVFDYEGMNPTTMKSALGAFEASFDPAEDFLVLTGHPINMAVVSAVALKVAQLNGNTAVRFLIFNKSAKEYDFVRNVSPGMIYNEEDM